MATNIWTLACAGTEKSFADWGFDQDSADGTFSNMLVDVLSLCVPGATIQSDPIFAFEAQVIVRRGRTGSGTSYTGGAIEFQGKRLLHVLDGRPEFEGVVYQFGGPWYDLDQTPYLQDVKVYGGDPDALLDLWQSEVILFFNRSSTWASYVNMTNGQQITAILNSLLTQYAALGLAAPFQIGEIDPPVALPTNQVKDLKCSEAIIHCMRSSPDCKVWFDYTTTPPTFNATKQGNCAAVSVAIGGGTSLESIKLTPRYDLQPSSVTLFFQQTNSISGQNWISTVVQQANSSGSTTTENVPTHPAGGLRGVVQTIDMQGITGTVGTGALVCVTVANTVAFWSRFLPQWGSPRIRVPDIDPGPDPGATVGFTILDDMSAVLDDNSGTVVDLSHYTSVLTDGSAAPWMTLTSGTPVTAVRALVKARISYDQSDADTGGRLLLRQPSQEIMIRVTLTNGVTGNYSSYLSAFPAEPIPTGLATNLFNSLATLQYQGPVSIIEQECSGSLGMGNVLNLTGGRTEWATMNAMIQQVHKLYGKGRTEVTIGPAAHLSAADLTQIFLVNRYRRNWNNPLVQASAQNTSGNNLVLGQNAPKENSTQGLGEPSQTTTSFDNGDGTRTIIRKDAQNQQITLFVVDSSGALVTSKPSFSMATGDIPAPSSGTALAMKAREYPICVMIGTPPTPTTQYVMLMGTTTYPNSGSPYT
jgi:hypothetical protein